MHLIVLLVYAAFFKEKVDDFRKEFTQGWKPRVFMSALYSIYIAYISMVAQVNLKKTELLIFVLLLAVMVTGYGVIFQTIYYMKKSTLNVQIERQQKMLEQKLEIMQKAEEETKRLPHDIRHHMANIAEYARNRQYEPLLAYLEQYGEEIEKTWYVYVDFRTQDLVNSIFKYKEGKKPTSLTAYNEGLGATESNPVANKSIELRISATLVDGD